MSYIHYLVPAPALHLPDRPALRRLADALFAGRWLVPSAEDRDHKPVVDQEDTPHLVGAPTAEELAELLAWTKNSRASQDVDFERYEHAALKDTPRDPLGVEDWHEDEDGYFGAYELAVIRHPHRCPGQWAAWP